MKDADLLLIMAGSKKPTQKKRKYTKKVEKAWQEAYDYLHNTMGKGTSDRAFRLMKRIRYALEADGYKFVNFDDGSRHQPGSSTTAPKSSPKLGDYSHVVCNGSVCTLLRTRPPKGLGLDALIRLNELFRSKQCFKFKVKPADKSKKRKRGKNMCLPKPATWHRLQRHGVEVEPIMDENTNLLMESFRIDGVVAYSCDRDTFYIPNPEMCRRWLLGLDRALEECLER